MLQKVQDELAKLIAQEIFNFAKQSGSNVVYSVKATTLTPRGKGVPESVLAILEKTCLKVLNDHWLKEHGCAKWRQGREEIEFNLLLAENLERDIKNHDWSAAGKLTAEGNAQIDAVGGDKDYNTAIDAAVPKFLECVVRAICGEYHKQTSTSGWRILTPVIGILAAPTSTRNFKTVRLLFKASGDEKETLKSFKLAKKLISGSWYRKGSSPSYGPYIR